MATQDPPDERCNANLPDGTLCQKEPVAGRRRCRGHGGLNTGPRTAEGKARSASRGLKHGIYANQLASYLDALGIPDDLWHSIPDSVDLRDEIRLIRSNILRYAQMLSKGQRWIHPNKGSEGEGAERILDDGAVVASLSGTSALSVEVLYQQALNQLRQFAKTQNEVSPASDKGGNLQVTLILSDEAAKVSDEDDIPRLTDDSPDDDRTPEEAGDAAPVSTNRTGYEDED